MTEIKIRLETLESFIGAVDALEDEFPDRVFVMGEFRGPGLVSWDGDTQTKRIRDFVYPAEIFADPDTLDDIAQADTRLACAALLPAEHADTDDAAVLDFDDLRNEAEAAADRIDGDAAFLIGGWHPDGGYRMYGNHENSKPRRVSEVQFPERIFTTPGTEPLKKIHTGLFGTLVLDQAAFNDESLAFMRGERDRLPLDERETVDPDEIRETLRGLSPGDRVVFNDRERPLTVSEYDEEGRRYAGGEALVLRGNGTQYHVHITPNSWPRLESATVREAIEEVDVVDTRQEVEA